MQPPDAALELVGLIYEAADDAKFWEPFLERLAKTLRAESAALIMHQKGQELHSVAASWRVDPESALLYQQHYGAIDVWAIQGHKVRAGYVCPSQEICTPAELSKTEIYNDFLSRFGVEHAMFGVIANNAQRWASVSLYRNSSSPEFHHRDGQFLRLLVPHIQRAFKLHFQFSELKANAARAESTLDMLTSGVIFLGVRGEVIFMNRKAGEIVARKDGLLVVKNSVVAAVAQESAALQRLINSAVQTGKGKGVAAGGTVLISRQKLRPITVTVAPLRLASVALEQRPTAVLFIADPDDKSEIPAGLLQRSYGLTPAEVRLTLALLEGHSLAEAADFGGMTHNTAKSHLKGIFTKTHVKRQSELVRLMLRSAGSFRVGARV